MLALMRFLAISALLAGALAAHAGDLTPEEVYELGRAGVPDVLLVAWLRADGGAGIDAQHILDLQQLHAPPAVVAELMRIDAARHDPKAPARAKVVVANRTGKPLGVSLDGRTLVLSTAPPDGAEQLAAGAQAPLDVEAVRLAVRLDGRDTRVRIDAVEGEETRLEVRAAETGISHARISRGLIGLFEGPLFPDWVKVPKPLDPTTVWSCQVHGDVALAKAGACPICGRMLIRRRDPAVAPAIPPFLGGDDPQDWDPSRPVIFVCRAHPEMWSRTPGRCPLCGVEMQQIK